MVTVLLHPYSQPVEVQTHWVVPHSVVKWCHLECCVDYIKNTYQFKYTHGKCTKSTPYVSEYSGKKQWGQQPSLDCRKTAQLLLDTCILRQVCMMIKNNNYHLACQRSSTHKMPNKNLEIQVIHDRSTYVYELLLPLRSSNSIHIIKYLFWEWLSTSLVIQGFTPTHCIDILWLLLALL